MPDLFQEYWAGWVCRKFMNESGKIKKYDILYGHTISAATDTTLTRILAFFAEAMAWWTFPGSHVESAETTNNTSRDPVPNVHESKSERPKNSHL